MATSLGGPHRASGLCLALHAIVMVGVWTATALAADQPPHGRDVMSLHRELARRAGLTPCPNADLDCRAFTGTLAWRPDERRPVLSSRALRRLALLRALNHAERERALRCLAFVAWAEARSDGIPGMRAVIAVVLNRSRTDAYPGHPCAVVTQARAFEPVGMIGYRITAAAMSRGALAPFPKPVSAVDVMALQMARLLVWNLALRPSNPDPTGGATHFLAPEVLQSRGTQLPHWAEQYRTTARIGGHQFFRAVAQASAAP
jgi:hypothetical protein